MIILRTLIAALGLALFLAMSAQAEIISPREANQHVGAQATVVGVVRQVSKSGGGTTFINFGDRFPNHVFYAVIFRSRSDQFPGVHQLQGRTVAISGEIELYKGKPQIILRSPQQIQVQ